MNATQDLTNQHFKHNVFQDKIGNEKNHNNLRHMKSRGSHENINWMCNLRNRASGIALEEGKAKSKPKWNGGSKK